MDEHTSDGKINLLADPARRRAMKCLAWSGAAVVWTVSGGVAKALGMANEDQTARAANGQFTFAQISDTHIGFKKDANPDVVGSLRRAIADLNALPTRPAFVVHTGDISHLSRPEEFDAAKQILRELKTDRILYVPGEHDALDDGLGGYSKHFSQGADGKPYYSFDSHGVHVVGLVNVVNFKPGSLALLGDEQLEWLERDLAGLSDSTPIVVLAHIPLWTVYQPWGWGTGDSPRALTYLRRFGSVTVLNGHIHQIMQKVEGNVAFHTAMSTAYPQPKPGAAPNPGPLKVPAGELGKLLGARAINVVPGARRLATIDQPLERAL
jgi:3',5'-cyclic-AMP phosphodiesterase